MGHVEIPYHLKRFIFHVESSFHWTKDLLVEEKRKEEDKWFSSRPLNPSRENSDEETQDNSLRVPRKVHYRHVSKDKQDAVHLVNLAHAQDLGFQFWQTKSNAVVIEDHLPAICIYRVTYFSERRPNSV